MPIDSEGNYIEPGRDLDLEYRCLSIAMKAHEGQKRKGGDPYILHPIRVAASFTSEDWTGTKLRCVALLHDVIEDTDMTVDELGELVPFEIWHSVIMLTRKDGVSYDQYMDSIKNCGYSHITKPVKIADMLDNLTDRPSDKQLEKYKQGILFLSS